MTGLTLEQHTRRLGDGHLHVLTGSEAQGQVTEEELQACLAEVFRRRDGGRREREGTAGPGSMAPTGRAGQRQGPEEAR